MISSLETISLKEKYRKNCCDWTFNPENAEKVAWHLSELCNQSLSGTDKIFRSTSIPEFLANPRTMHRATEIFQATEDDVCTQCLSALTCRCFEDFVVTEAQAVTDESKFPTAVRTLQWELCSLVSLAPSTWNAKLVISQAHWKHKSVEPNYLGAHSRRATSSPCSEVLCPNFDHPLPNVVRKKWWKQDLL